MGIVNEQLDMLSSALLRRPLIADGQTKSIAHTGRLHYGVELRMLINSTLFARCPSLILQLIVAIVFVVQSQTPPHESMGIVDAIAYSPPCAHNKQTNEFSPCPEQFLTPSLSPKHNHLLARAGPLANLYLKKLREKDFRSVKVDLQISADGISGTGRVVLSRKP
jgi:hypothetical protein